MTTTKLPKYFGLRLYPGMVFRISSRKHPATRYRPEEVELDQLEIDRIGSGVYVWTPSVRGTLESLRAEIVRTPKVTPIRFGKKKRMYSGGKRKY